MPQFERCVEPSQKDLIWEQLIGGNQAALKVLYHEYAQLLYNYGRHISSDVDLVKDCIHDLFLDLWKNHKRLNSTTCAKFYLYKALRRKIISETKKVDRQLSAPQPSSEKVEVHHLFEFPQAERLIRRERKAKLIAAVNALPRRQSEVVTLIFFENLTREEVAEVMEVDTATVYSLTWKAIKTLRRDPTVTTTALLLLCLCFLF